MALAAVGAKKIESGSAGSVTVNGAYTATTGNLMVVGLVEYTSSAAAGATASDNNNGSYVQINESALFVAGSNARVALLYHANITGGSLNLTANGGTACTAVTASFQEVSGADTTAPFTAGEQSSSGLAASTNPRTSSVTNSVANSIFFAVVADDDASATATLTVNSTGSAPTGWALKDATNSQETNGNSFGVLSMPFLITSSSAGTVHGWTTSSHPSATSCACFKEASASGSIPPGLGPGGQMDAWNQASIPALMR